MRELLIILSFISLNVRAQDVIVKKDGSTILSKVLEVNVADIKYKKFSKPNGPTYSISKSDILSVNYENGEKDSFNTADIPAKEETNAVANNGEPVLVNKDPDVRNKEIIELYNHDVTPTNKISKSNDEAKACYTIWNIAPTSIMSNEDVEINLTRSVEGIHHFDAVLISGHHGQSFYPMFVYHINIKNKTEKVIYIDKGNCFRIIDDGSTFCYYDPSEQTTVSHGSGSGISIGLGSIAGVLGIGGGLGQLADGIVMGGGSSNSVSTTYSQQRIIAIPPHGNRNLTTFKKVDQYPWKIVEHAEYFATKTSRNVPKRGVVKRGEVLTFNTNNSPWRKKYIITYSTLSNFKTYSTVQFELFLHEMIGTKYLMDDKFIRSHYNKLEKYINGINERTIIDWDFIEK